MGFNLQVKDYKTEFVITRDEQSSERVPIQMNSEGVILQGTIMIFEGTPGNGVWREAVDADFPEPTSNDMPFNKLAIVKRIITGTPDAIITDRGSLLLEGEVSKYGVKFTAPAPTVWQESQLMRNFIYLVDTTSGKNPF